MRPWLDAHLDLAYLAVEGRDLRVEHRNAATGCVSLPALRDAGVETALGTIFTAPAGDGSGGPYTYPSSDDLDAAERCGVAQLDVYRRLEDAGELTIVRSRGDLERPAARPAIVLLMEGADPVRSAEQVAWWHERGVRAVGLAWAAGTRYAGGNANPGPLTAAGRDLVAALDAAGIIHDLSHLADAAFDDVLACASGPVVATHSNCRALLGDDERHLRDGQIRAVGDRGGVVGLNLLSTFLRRQGRAGVGDCVAHVEHASAVIGHRRSVGLGSDMDGGFPPGDLPEGLEHPRHLPRLAEGLTAAGWSAEEVEGFRHRNWRDLLARALPA